MNPFNRDVRQSSLEILQWLIGKDIESIPYEVLSYLSEMLDNDDRDCIVNVLHEASTYLSGGYKVNS